MNSLNLLVSLFGYSFIDNSYRFVYPNLLLIKNIINLNVIK